MAGGRVRRRRPGAILLLLLTQVLLAGIYADLTPLFEGPDAEGHLAYIAQQQADGLARAPLNTATAARSHELIQQPPLYYRLAALLAGDAQARPLADRYQRNLYYPGLSQRVAVPWRAGAPDVEWPARVVVWLSMLGAVLAAAATYGMARLLWPAEGTLALAAAAVGLVLGLALGSAALTKYSGLLVLSPLGLMLLGPLWRRPLAMIGPLAAAAVAWLASAGPWYLANLRQSGQLIPTTMMHRLLPDLAREAPIAWTAAIRESMWLQHSYWGVFGHGFLAEPWYYGFIGLICMLAGIGGVVAAVRALRTWPRRVAAAAPSDRPWIWLSAWLLVSYAALLLWIRSTQFANQGRLLFGAAPAIALLLVTGWRSLAPRRRRSVDRSVVVVMAALAVGQLATLMAAFRPAPALAVTHPARSVQAVFAPGMRLLGMDIETPTVEGGEPLSLRLYWTTARPIEVDAMTFVHLVDEAGHKLAAADQVPLSGRHPTRAWRPGEVFAERWRLPVAAVAEDTVAQLVVGAYAGENPANRLAVRDADGRPLGDELRLGPVLIRPRDAVDPPCPLGVPTGGAVRWHAGMDLVGVALKHEASPVPLDIALCWRSDTEPQRDLSLFVQLLDAGDHILAQWDGQPLNGLRPVSTWQRGTRLQDEVRLTPAPAADPATWQRIILGWYDPRSGVREPLRNGQDHAVLIERDLSRLSPVPPTAP
ncbi:MAG: hypothetical protein IPL60_12985 [Ardenticatenia bacterium]|nr:hypothetical protein [Ardenticatenia bacterium]